MSIQNWLLKLQENKKRRVSRNTWTPANPLTERNLSHSAAMSLYGHSNKCTIALLSSHQWASHWAFAAATSRSSREATGAHFIFGEWFRVVKFPVYIVHLETYLVFNHQLEILIKALIIGTCSIFATRCTTWVYYWKILKQSFIFAAIIMFLMSLLVYLIAATKKIRKRSVMLTFLFAG